MCLYADFETTEKFKNENKELITVYKAVRKDTKVGCLVILGSIYSCYQYKPGWNKSRRKVSLSKKEKQTNRVNYGIHVYLDLNEARSHYAKFSLKGYSIIKCQAKLLDLVAVNNSMTIGVFTQIYIPPTTYKRVTKNQIN